MTTSLLRGAAAFCPALTPLALPSPTAAAATTTEAAAVVPVPEVLPLEDAVGRLPVAEEDRTGYTRDSFKHWNTASTPPTAATPATRSSSPKPSRNRPSRPAAS